MGGTTHSDRKKIANLVKVLTSNRSQSPLPQTLKVLFPVSIKSKSFFGLCPVPASSAEVMYSTVPLKVKEPFSSPRRKK